MLNCILQASSLFFYCLFDFTYFANDVSYRSIIILSPIVFLISFLWRTILFVFSTVVLISFLLRTIFLIIILACKKWSWSLFYCVLNLASFHKQFSLYKSCVILKLVSISHKHKVSQKIQKVKIKSITIAFSSKFWFIYKQNKTDRRGKKAKFVPVQN